MSRHYYCSECGTELILKRKALRNKQVVIDSLDPHICDEEKKNIANIQDNEQAPTAYERQVRQEANLRPSSVGNADDQVFQDFRDKKFLREGVSTGRLTSSAPLGVLAQVKGAIASKPERPMSEIEDEEA